MLQRAHTAVYVTVHSNGRETSRRKLNVCVKLCGVGEGKGKRSQLLTTKGVVACVPFLSHSTAIP